MTSSRRSPGACPSTGRALPASLPPTDAYRVGTGDDEGRGQSIEGRLDEIEDDFQ